MTPNHAYVDESRRGSEYLLAVILVPSSLVRATTRKQRGTLSPTLQYSHRGSKDELLLSLPDAFAWCWGAGGTWRDRIRPLIGSVIRP
ncbi:MAG: hypothetical protein JWN46_3396 [Acidimicrobiales bacterium]|nr:hypothetical protein [Acidimicrobiales bacterium]